MVQRDCSMNGGPPNALTALIFSSFAACSVQHGKHYNDLDPPAAARRASWSLGARLPDFILLMHNDAAGDEAGDAWSSYLARVKAEGAFQGGSAIGGGTCGRKSGAADISHARRLLARQPRL